MIRAFLDYALNNRFIVVVVAVLLLAWGAIAFHGLPVEAYPDVANNYVQIITQWPGHAAEDWYNAEQLLIGQSNLELASRHTSETGQIPAKPSGPPTPVMSHGGKA